jgi:hypothetical protein
MRRCSFAEEHLQGLCSRQQRESIWGEACLKYGVGDATCRKGNSRYLKKSIDAVKLLNRFWVIILSEKRKSWRKEFLIVC